MEMNGGDRQAKIVLEDIPSLDSDYVTLKIV